MKILHTSDWHLGRTLYGRKRYEEFATFLDWLAQTIETERVDVLLLAGDVFDTSAPSNRAQSLYYRFLSRITASACRHVVVIAGNHDSPTFLDAPRELLQVLAVQVVGAATEQPEDEVLVLDDLQGAPELIVCAVPYLRDRDIRIVEAGESIDSKEQKLVEGIRQHYAAVGEVARQRREALGGDIPIIGMGHLFTAGGQTVDGDGVRELYVGSLAHVTGAIFPEVFDYLALGHLHVPQKVGGAETRRYSGSPLPMGFGEARQQKSVCLLDFSGGSQPAVRLIDVPKIQHLERLSGDWETLSAGLAALVAAGSDAWLEILYDGADVIPDLRQRLEAIIEGSALEILRIRNNRIVERALGQMREDETLDDLDIQDVFMRCLDAHDTPDVQREVLLAAYREVVTALDEEDGRAE